MFNTIKNACSLEILEILGVSSYRNKDIFNQLTINTSCFHKALDFLLELKFITKVRHKGEVIYSISPLGTRFLILNLEMEKLLRKV